MALKEIQRSCFQKEEEKHVELRLREQVLDFLLAMSVTQSKRPMIQSQSARKGKMSHRPGELGRSPLRKPLQAQPHHLMQALLQGQPPLMVCSCHEISQVTPKSVAQVST